MKRASRYIQTGSHRRRIRREVCQAQFVVRKDSGRLCSVANIGARRIGGRDAKFRGYEIENSFPSVKRSLPSP